MPFSPLSREDGPCLAGTAHQLNVRGVTLKLVKDACLEIVCVVANAEHLLQQAGGAIQHWMHHLTKC